VTEEVDFFSGGVVAAEYIEHFIHTRIGTVKKQNPAISMKTGFYKIQL
jgi:hypothetical protein